MCIFCIYIIIYLYLFYVLYFNNNIIIIIILELAKGLRLVPGAEQPPSVPAARYLTCRLLAGSRSTMELE